MNKLVNALELLEKRVDIISYTENGGIGYKTTENPLLDINFLVSSLRNMDEDEIISRFEEAYKYDPYYAVLWLFYLRDITEGCGERRSFRVIMKWLANNVPTLTINLLGLIPSYGRFDDLIALYDCGCPEVREAVVVYIQSLLTTDYVLAKNGENISLLAKWMPSINTSSPETRKLAKNLVKEFGMSEKEYRKTLSFLRGYLKVVEKDLSANNISGIDYSSVPAKANLNYSKTFMRKDHDRRMQYLIDCIENGTSKMNIKGIAPYEIIAGLKKFKYAPDMQESDLIANHIWNKMIEDGYENNIGLKDCLCVLDGSGSMCTTIGGTEYTAMDVARGLSIYFSQTMKGAFHNKIMEFSSKTRWIDISGRDTLREVFDYLDKFHEYSTTNIEGVFTTLLSTAVENNVPSEDMPDQILIISDMEFDCIGDKCDNKAIFDHFDILFHNAGYKMPKLVFWNVISRTYTIPKIDEGDNGLILLSGFSQKSAAVINTNKKDPYEALTTVLDSERYKPVSKILCTTRLINRYKK